MKRSDLLQLIAKDQGMNLGELGDVYGNDSIVPGICTSEDCLAISDCCEPDARANWCTECNNGTVQSFLVLMGVI